MQEALKEESHKRNLRGVSETSQRRVCENGSENGSRDLSEVPVKLRRFDDCDML